MITRSPKWTWLVLIGLWCFHRFEEMVSEQCSTCYLLVEQPCMSWAVCMKGKMCAGARWSATWTSDGEVIKMLDGLSHIGLAFFGVEGLGVLQYSVLDGLNINVTYWLQTYGQWYFSYLVSWVMPSMVRDMLEAWKEGWVGRGGSGTIWLVFPLCLIWCIWRERNARCFEGAEISVVNLKYLFLKTYMSGLHQLLCFLPKGF